MKVKLPEQRRPSQCGVDLARPAASALVDDDVLFDIDWRMALIFVNLVACQEAGRSHLRFKSWFQTAVDSVAQTLSCGATLAPPY